MIEETLAALIAAITENTTVLREVLAAGSDTKIVHTITPVVETPKPAKKKAEKAEKVEPEPVLSEAAEKIIKDASDKITAEKVAIVNAAAEKIVSERCTVTEEPTALDPEVLITQITDTWKAQLTAADPERKVMLKDKFPELRAKWGLAADAKLITLAPTPEKLAGLLADIKAL